MSDDDDVIYVLPPGPVVGLSFPRAAALGATGKPERSRSIHARVAPGFSRIRRSSTLPSCIPRLFLPPLL
jgi:hypothetical protein